MLSKIAPRQQYCDIEDNGCIHMKAEQTFPEWMKEERERRGLTQRDLAELADIHFSTLANTETGRREPTADFVVSICSALDSTPKETIAWLARINVWKRPIDLGDAADDWWIAACKRAARGLPEAAIRQAVGAFKGSLEGYADAMTRKGGK